MNLLLWFWMLTKRLYKKPAFLVILALIPITVLLYSLAAKEESGVLTVALVAQEQVCAELEQEGQLLRYVRCDSAARAELLVAAGKADAAWIFPEDLQERAEAFMLTPTAENAFVRVVQREENVALALAREKLSGVLLPLVSRSYYLHFLRQNYPELAHLPDAKLLEYYDGTDMGGTLFEYDSAEGNLQQVHYLMSPVRGILAVVIFLGGMAAAMYRLKDEENGTFCWVPARYQFLTELGSQLVTGIHLCAVSLAALLISGQSGALLPECLCALLYSLTVALFCMVMRRLLGSIRALGAALPIMVVAMLLICPVFFDLGALRGIQLLLPPAYYINGVFDSRYLLYMIPYMVLCSGVCFAADWLHLQQTGLKEPL